MTTTATPNALDSLAGITHALGMDTGTIAAKLGVSSRTVKAWIIGLRRPSEHNRAALLALVTEVQTGHSGRRQGFSTRRDNALRQTRIALQTPAQRTKWFADRAAMRAGFLRLPA